LAIKVLGVHASPRKAATAYALTQALEAARGVGDVETEFLELRGRDLRPCIHCNRCIKDGVRRCPAFPGDGMEEFYDKLPRADCLIFATPVYDMAPSAQAHIFMNRLRPLGPTISAGAYGTMTACGIAVGGARNGGQEMTLAVLNNFFLCQGMVVAGAGVFAYAGASVWSKDKLAAGVQEDEQGLSNIGMAARRAVIAAKLLKAGLAQHPDLTGSQLAGFLNDAHRDEVRAAFRNKK